MPPSPSKDLSHVTFDNDTVEGTDMDDEEEGINFASSRYILQNLQLAHEDIFLDSTGTLAARSYISRSVSLQVSFLVYAALRTFNRAPTILIIGAGHNGKILINHLIDCGCSNFIRIYARGDYTTNYWNSRNVRASNSMSELMEQSTADIIVMCSGMSSFSSVCRMTSAYVSQATFFISSCFGLPRKRVMNTLKTPNVWRTYQESTEIMAVSEGKSFTDVFENASDGCTMEEQAADLIVRRCPNIQNMIFLLENYYALRGMKHVDARREAIVALLGGGLGDTETNVSVVDSNRRGSNRRSLRIITEEVEEAAARGGGDEDDAFGGPALSSSISTHTSMMAGYASEENPAVAFLSRSSSVVASEHGVPAGENKSDDAASAGSLSRSGSLSGPGRRKSILEQRKEEKRQKELEEQERLRIEAAAIAAAAKLVSGSAPGTAKSGTPGGISDVENALAELERSVAVPFQRHFSRHIRVADIPRVDLVDPKAGGLVAKRRLSVAITELAIEIESQEAKAMKDLYAEEDDFEEGFETGNKKKGPGALAMGLAHGMNFDAEEAGAKRKVRILDKTMMANEDGGGTTFNSTITDDTEQGSNTSAVSAYEKRKRELEQIRMATKLKVIEDIDSKPKPRDPMGVAMHEDDVILALLEEDVLLHDPSAHTRMGRSAADLLLDPALSNYKTPAEEAKAARFRALKELLEELDDAEYNNSAEYDDDEDDDNLPEGDESAETEVTSAEKL